MNARRTADAGLIAVVVSLAGAGSAHGDIVTEWNTTALNAIKSGSTPPPFASRALALMHTAMYDANNAVTKTRQSYLPIPVAPTGASREAAVAQAARNVLATLYPSQAATFDAKLATHLSSIAPGQSRDDGVALGSTVASNFLAHRANDGSSAPTPWTPGNQPTSWKPTGGSATPLFNQFCLVQPWTMSGPSQFRQGAPALPGSSEFVAAYNEVKELGSATSATRTADQTEIAKFWAAGGGTVTPPGMWNNIAQVVSGQNSTSFDDNLRLFAVLNMATADAAITSWDMKFHYDYFRPVTGIRAMEDPSWTPLLTTPQFQAYTSGHSTFSSASAAVLAAMFGDATNFSLTVTDASLGLTDVTRSFNSFTGAAAEAGQSRIYGGIHWQFDNTAGLVSGALVGAQAYANFLQVPTPGVGAVVALGGLMALRRRR
ncbi:MAG: phosphatase PAP2 family protein [Phycisphaerales bacterium]